MKRSLTRDLSDLSDLSGVFGDLDTCAISDGERDRGINIEDLIGVPEQEEDHAAI